MASPHSLRDGSHRRLNPLTGEWVLVSPRRRLQRPWQGRREPEAAPAALTHDPSCYLCAGNLRAGGARNPGYSHTFVFDNDFPALKADAPAEREGGGLLVAKGESEICRVLCFSPRHDLTLDRHGSRRHRTRRRGLGRGDDCAGRAARHFLGADFREPGRDDGRVEPPSAWANLGDPPPAERTGEGNPQPKRALPQIRPAAAPRFCRAGHRAWRTHGVRQRRFLHPWSHSGPSGRSRR